MIYNQGSILLAAVLASLMFIPLLIIETIFIYGIVCWIRSCGFRISWTKKKKYTMIWVSLMMLITTIAIIGFGLGLFGNNVGWEYGLILICGPYTVGAIGAIYLSIVLTDGSPKIK